MQIRKNLYQVGGDQSGITWAGVDAGYEDCNTYVLATPDGLILFDCGCGETLGQIFDNMQYWELDPQDIRYCLITHPHFDHAAGAHLLKERGITLIAHRNTAEAMAAGDERCCGFLYHKTFVPCQVDRQVNDGDHLELCGAGIEVMHLPGHSMGCTAYFFNHEGKRIAVSGDVIGTLNVGDFGWSGSIDFDKKLYLESLKRLAKVDMDLMLGGHGPVYFHKPRRRVEQALNSALMQWR
ncbi:MAG: MBL fold metallo-hydrolase [Candidatus Hydrogenedentes bacterium]|nr:MBL fold metallo-hydrolase [Candidatus Hydrogenedentota bacterium]MBI3119449.1 MBL fold metallo-hydrolase [Candidatus Hydrogenedentota bacterium]